MVNNTSAINSHQSTHDTEQLTADSLQLTLTKKFKDKIFIILGLGREGLSTYTFLREHFLTNQILLLDEKPLEELNQKWQQIQNEDKNTKYQTLVNEVPTSKFLAHNAEHRVAGGKVPAITNQGPGTKDRSPFDYRFSNIVIFKSPGISPHSDFYKQAINQYPDAEITSNTNLFFELMKDRVRIIGVTGTKGKSTTTSAIYHVLKESLPQPVFLGGNIGVPPLDLITQIDLTFSKKELLENNKQFSKPLSKPVVVLELSSHQLLNLKYSPHTAVIQEIVPEHLDYYQDFNEYVYAKSNIAANQTIGDEIIYNSKYLHSKNIAMLNKTEGIFKFDINLDPLLSEDDNQDKVLALNSGIISYNNEDIIEIKDLKIKGEHNLLNIAPAIIIAKHFGVSNKAIRAALQSFKPLKHRLELVATVDGVEYYNDSLATTPEATIAAMSAFPDKQIILIAGGYDRHLDFKELAAEIVKRNVKKLLLFKPTGQFIIEAIKNIDSRSSVIDYQYIETMQAAVKEAYGVSEPGDIVLMSPASASFGRFKDYADRGEQFEKAVHELSSKI